MTETPTPPDKPEPQTPPPAGAYPFYPGSYPPYPVPGQFAPYPYPYPYAAAATTPAPRNGVGTAALIVGVAATLLSCTLIGGILGGFVAVVLGVVGLIRVKRSEADNRGVAIAGIVLGGFALLLSALILTFAVYLVSSAGFGEYLTCATSANGDQSKIMQCQNDFQNRLNGRLAVSPSVSAPPAP